MKLDPGQSIQTLANIGVIAGIVFLGLELQQNNELMSAQQRYNQLSILTGSTGMVAENPELAETMAILQPEVTEAIRQSLDGAHSLTPAQIQQVTNFGARIILNQQWQFKEMPAHELPLDIWRFGSTGPHWKFTWSWMAPLLDSEFVEFMEENVISAP